MQCRCVRASAAAFRSSVLRQTLLRRLVEDSPPLQRQMVIAPRTVHNVVSRWQSSNSSKNAQNQTKEEEEEDPGPNWKVIVGIGLFAAGLGGYLNIRQYQLSLKQKAQHEANVGVGGQTVTGDAVGRPSLGGDFLLINQDGKLTRNTDFHGQWAFLYFGFTYCPDICPNELTRMVDVLNLLDKDKATAEKLLPIYITIDPERDGAQQLKDYLSDWHPRLVGLTGSPAQIADVTSKYRVYYSKARMGDDPRDYLIDHSVMFYLVDPKGQFTEYFGANATVEDMHAKIAAYIKGWKP